MYHMAGEKFKPISLGYLCLCSYSILFVSVMHLVGVTERVVICNLVTLVLFLLSLGYSVVWLANTRHLVVSIMK